MFDTIINFTISKSYKNDIFFVLRLPIVYRGVKYNAYETLAQEIYC